MKTIPIAAAMLIALTLGACSNRPALQTVRQVDMPRYSGKWHEVARYPNWFQRKCAGDVTADYRPQPDGSVRVVNSCRRQDGSKEEAVGRATVVPGSGNAKLKVSFAGPFTGDYWIIGLDEKDYSWALVGHPSRRYLWILSRQPKLSETTYREIVSLAKAQGYDPNKIVRTPAAP